MSSTKPIRAVESERQQLLKRPHVVVFSDSKQEAKTMEVLHPTVRLQGADLVDFYVSSAVVADRIRPEFQNRPAILFFTNKEDLAPGTKLGDDFYAAQRRVFRPDFQLVAAMKDWDTDFAS